MLMTFLEIFWGFFKIGLFTIGGGYAMLPVMQQEIAKYGWITAGEFIDIIAIAEMTPGAIAVNTATFAGFRTAGVLGAVLATASLALPSLLIIIPLSNFWEVHQDHPVLKSIFAGVKPAVAGLIGAAAIYIARTAFLYDPLLSQKDGFPIDLRSIIIAGAVFVAVRKLKADPIKTIIAAALVGLVVFGL
ncbi:MAG: chromate transporter [Limnochordia bacterium]|nr:chromate transporter [Limnochordia bacterium]